MGGGEPFFGDPFCDNPEDNQSNQIIIIIIVISGVGRTLSASAASHSVAAAEAAAVSATINNNQQPSLVCLLRWLVIGMQIFHVRLYRSTHLLQRDAVNVSRQFMVVIK